MTKDGSVCCLVHKAHLAVAKVYIVVIEAIGHRHVIRLLVDTSQSDAFILKSLTIHLNKNQYASRRRKSSQDSNSRV